MIIYSVAALSSSNRLEVFQEKKQLGTTALTQSSPNETFHPCFHSFTEKDLDVSISPEPSFTFTSTSHFETLEIPLSLSFNNVTR